jgi:hypothetical protein
VFQPAFALHPGVRWPADYDEQDGHLRCFAAGPAIWVGDPDRFTSPYWLTADEAAHVAALRPGAALPAALARALVEIGAIEIAAPADPRAWFAAHHAAYEARGYAIAADLLPARELAALRRYYAALLAAGLLPLGDRQNAARFSTYNDPISCASGGARRRAESCARRGARRA